MIFSTPLRASKGVRWDSSVEKWGSEEKAKEMLNTLKFCSRCSDCSHLLQLLAAMKIYDANCPGFEINPCRFFDSNSDALADMKKMAEQ